MNIFLTDAGIICKINDDNAKCKRIAFDTTDETLVRSAMMKLGFQITDFKVKKCKINGDDFIAEK